MISAQKVTTNHEMSFKSRSYTKASITSTDSLKPSVECGYVNMFSAALDCHLKNHTLKWKIYKQRAVVQFLQLSSQDFGERRRMIFTLENYYLR